MTASVALYDLSNARAILDEWLNESEGEFTPELEALLAELDVKADEKIERVALYIRPSVKGEVDAAALWDMQDGDVVGVWRPLLRYIPESFALDRKAALDAYKAGQPLPEGLTVEQGTSLRIR